MRSGTRSAQPAANLLLGGQQPRVPALQARPKASAFHKRDIVKRFTEKSCGISYGERYHAFSGGCHGCSRKSLEPHHGHESRSRSAQEVNPHPERHRCFRLAAVRDLRTRLKRWILLMPKGALVANAATDTMPRPICRALPPRLD